MGNCHQTSSYKVPELETKKWVFGSGGWTKHIYFLEKYDELSESVVAFSQKLKYLLDQNGSEGGPHVFSNSEMNVTDRAER